MRSPGITNVGQGYINDKLDAIHGLDAAELVLSATGGTLTADGSEQTLYIDNEPLGCQDSRVLFVDLDNMLAGDVTVLRVYYRIADAGGLQLCDYEDFSGIDGGLTHGCKLTTVECRPNRHGIQVTLEQTAGTNRTYAWEFLGEL